MQIYGQIPDFNKKISTVRSRGIALIPILQNLGQFQNRYPNGLADEIIGNCDTRIDMGITDVLTAEYFCDLIGVSTVETTSIRKANSIEGDIIEYGQKNISKQQRNLLNVDEILRIPSNKLILNLRGNKPLQLDKMIYKEHSLSTRLKDISVNEYNPKWIQNIPQKLHLKENLTEKSVKKEEKLGWNNF